MTQSEKKQKRSSICRFTLGKPTSQIWASPKPGSLDAILVSCMIGRNPGSWAISNYLPGELTGSQIRYGAVGTHTSTPIWDGGTASCNLTYCSTMPAPLSGLTNLFLLIRITGQEKILITLSSVTS